MSSRRLLARSISECFAAVSFLRPARTGLRVLMYHAIGSPALDDRLGLFSLSPGRFRDHMDRLAGAAAYRVVPFDAAAPAGAGRRVAITFDDGYRDNLTEAAPVLARHGLPFTVFVTSEFVRNSRPGFLSPVDLRELAAMPGATIGAHGANHVALAQCDDAHLEQELTGSRLYLEDVLGRPVNTMAYPFGSADRRVRAATERAGYALAACSLAGLNAPGRDPLLLARTEISAHDTGRVFAQKLRGDWDWYRWRTPDPAGL